MVGRRSESEGGSKLPRAERWQATALQIKSSSKLPHSRSRAAASSIVDVQPPGAELEAAWLTDGPAVVDRLRKGGRVLVHCRGGLGRAGTVASLLAVELGHDPEDALRQIRAVRPGAVETRAQEGYVLGYLRRGE